MHLPQSVFAFFNGISVFHIPLLSQFYLKMSIFFIRAASADKNEAIPSVLFKLN